ncbi:MAG: hypothetical protein Ct9H90mP16_14340 [Candidatus Poseidoniales archaeon]|nr:MAG: hypothetical protein Ct9H90mP16_14340 [Candidatus Poseidoniales archaeon]
MDSGLGGVLTWGAENGAMDNASGAFTGDQIGNWGIWVWVGPWHFQQHQHRSDLR